MDIMVRLRRARRIAWLLICAFAVPYLSVGAMAASKTADATPRSVVVFPMENAQGVANDKVGAELNTLLRDALGTYPGYRVVIYSERLPAVQRVVAVQPDKKSLISGPFSTDKVAVERAVSLGKAMSADLVVVGTVDKYVFNDAAGIADVTVSAQLIDALTGKPVQTLTVAGRGVGKTTRTEGVSEALVQRDAAKDAVRKMMKAITGEEYREPVQGTPVVIEKKSSKKSWIPMLLLSLGVGLLLGGGGSSGGSASGGDTGGTEPPPPPPL